MTGLLAFAPWGFELPLPVVLLGAITGISYGLLAVGIVLVYRSNRIINFAHGEIGAFGAALLVLLVNRWSVPYYLAAVIVLAAAAGVGALAEVGVVRRLQRAPRLMSIVATLGVGQLLVFVGLAITPGSAAGFAFPSPPGLPQYTIGGLRLTQAHIGMLVFGPLVVLALTVFLRRSRFGLAMRCAAANPDSARLSGISASAMSSLSWALAGAMSAFTAMLVLPARGFAGGESFGPSLLLRALVGAVLARMENLPVALAAGVGLGVAEQLLLWNSPSSDLVDVVLFGVIVLALLVQRGVGGRNEEKGSWAAAQGWRPLREHVQQLPEVRLVAPVLALVAIVGAALLPLVVTSSASVTLTQIGCFAVIGVSVGIITGLGGQLSLGQMAIAGIGAVVSFQVSSRVGAFPLALLYAGLAAAVVSVLVGLPALRIRGLLLTVSTLGFGLAASGWLLGQSWAFGAGVDPGRPVIFGHALDTSREYYWFALVVVVVVLLLARNVRRGAVGRMLVAVRDNEDNARAFTIPARLVRLQGFALAGFVAGVGGALYGHLLPSVGASAFPNRASIDVVAMAVIGGTSLLVGPLLGALYIIGIPAFLPLDSAGLAATQLGWLILVLYLPGGLAQGLEPVRARYVRWAAGRHGLDPDADPTAPAPAPPAGSPVGVGAERVAALGRFGAPAGGPRTRAGTLLRATGLQKAFGGVRAVDGVDLRVREGEIVGLIGPNGAGKTTTFELLGGFTLPDRGRVAFDGEDVSDLGPEARAERGLIRSFQDAALFPTLTVLDTARLAFERTAPSSLLASVLGLRGAERDKDRLARALVGTMGLDAYRHATIQELSTGTRRITELACLVALQPRLLLLDEPSSGVAQRETEALGRLLRDLHAELGLALVVIEHDIPLIMGLSDRIVAMDAGRVIAEGPPEEVRHHPEVVASYLGGDLAAVERSGAGRPRAARTGASRPDGAATAPTRRRPKETV
jgi:ABC-type branched-subunit amino acid transport system ATPase component/ABC-type branched-subunit amino acid transport system permease subunit